MTGLVRRNPTRTTLCLLLLAVFGMTVPPAALQRFPGNGPSFSFFRQSDEHRSLILFVDVVSKRRRSDDDGWRSTAQDVQKNERMQQYDIATQTAVLSEDVLQMDKMVGEMLREWEEQRLLRYDAVWVVTDALGGMLARELVIRQPLLASKVRRIAWYEPAGTLLRRDLGVVALLPDLGGADQKSALAEPLDKFVERQTTRWLPVAGANEIDVHCASPSPVSSSVLARFECRSISVVLDPTSQASPGGTANLVLWLLRLTRLPSSATRAKPSAVRSMKLAAPDMLQVSCGSTSYAAPKIVLPEGIKGKIRSAYGLLEDATNILKGSVTVREFSDREVFVTAELSGLGSFANALSCPAGQARAVVLLTIEEDGK